MKARRSLAREAGLIAVAFLATLILLAGLALGLTGRAPTGSPGPTSGAASLPAVGFLTPSPTASGGASHSASVSPSADPVLVGAGDIADCSSSGDEETAKLIDGIAGTVFTAGDGAYPDGTAGQYADCYGPTWGRFKARTRPAVGNHDYQTKGAAGYLGYFGAASTNADGQTWYSFDLGRWHIIVLDANCGEIKGCDSKSAEGHWLSADLDASDARCTLAIWHQPRFSSGEHGNDLAVGPFWTALYRAGADVVVNGHDHDYERFKPQTPSGAVDFDRGIREFVAGTGGAPIRGFQGTKPNSDIRAAVSPGVLKLTLHPNGYDWAFVSTTGIFSDSGTASCH